MDALAGAIEDCYPAGRIMVCGKRVPMPMVR